MDARGDVLRVGRQGVADGLDVLQLPVGLVGDQLPHPDREILTAQLQGQGAGVAGDHPLVVEEERRGPDGAADHLHRAGVVVAVVREAARRRSR